MSYRIILVILLCVATQLRTREPVRTVRDNTLASDRFPAIRVQVQKEFKFLGRIPLNIKNIAVGERFVFVHADQNLRIHRMFIVQMEGFLADVEEIYRWKMENPRRLGHHDYRHNV